VFDRGWLARQGLCIDPWIDALRVAAATGVFKAPRGETSVRMPRAVGG
jgi:hypothetical protein